MRLDHLLSKEHVHRSSVYSEITGASHTRPNGLGGAHGWNIDIGMRTIGSHSVRPVRKNGVGKVGSEESHICTLLGPEGPEHEHFGVGDLILLDFFSLASLAGGKGYRPYFENYTVDASILNLTLVREQITKIYALFIECVIIGQFRSSLSSGDT